MSRRSFRAQIAAVEEEQAKAEAAGVAPAADAGHERRAPKDFMGQFLGDMSKGLEEQARESSAEAKALRAKLEKMQASLHVLELDPAEVHPSRFCDRHPLSLSDADAAFRKLKDEIAAAKGNESPIAVREVGPNSYEVIFGHRRHAACKALGLPVRAMVLPGITDQELALAMERENSSRTAPSGFERGMHYQELLRAKVYASQRELATALGRSHTDIRRMLAFAQLPKAVVDAFADPRAIRVTWVDALARAYEEDRDGVVARGRALAGKSAGAHEVFMALSGKADAGDDLLVTRGSEVVARFRARSGRVEVRLSADAPAELRTELRKLMKDWQIKLANEA